MSRTRLLAIGLSIIVLLYAGGLRVGRAAYPAAAPTLPSGPYDPMTVQENAVIDGFQGARFFWDDRDGNTRTALMVRNDQTDPKGNRGGYMRQITYVLGDGTTRTVNGRLNDHSGFGFVVNHYGSGGTQGVSTHHVTGTYQAVLRGRHHAIHQYKWRLNPGGPMDVTVQWFFATGRDHPIYAITYDCSPAGPDVIYADTRSPYGDMHWDGGADVNVAGVGWGDRYRFRSLGNPITMNNGWDYSQPNLIPHVIEWATQVDAEMGLVQTQTYLQHDGGGYWFYPSWGQTDSNGPMPEDWNWTYQLNQYEIEYGAYNSKRMAWGANFGAVGRTSYPAYGDDKNLVGYPYQSYSVFVVLDRHSRTPVDSLIAEMEAMQHLALTASVGSVATSGVGGAGRTDTVTYQPTGYNPIYSVWELIANASSQSTFRFAMGSYTVTNPIFVVRNYTATQAPATIMVNGAAKAADADYYASLDDQNDRLWITLKGNFTGNTDVVITPGTTPPQTLSIENASVTEGNNGTINATFTVTLSPGN